MAFALRAALLLLATAPLFVATSFHPPLWQVLVAAVLGSGAGHLAVRATRTHPKVRAALLIVALSLLTGSLVWLLRPTGAATVAPVNLLLVKNGERPALQLDDVAALRDLPEVAAITPVRRSNEQLISEDQNWNAQVLGTTPAVLAVRGWRVADGAPFTDDDVASAAKVLVLGPTTARQLFGTASALGQTLRLKGRPFTVVGVLAPTGSTIDDDLALVPLSTFERVLGAGPGAFTGSFWVAPRPDASGASVRALLRARHHLAEADADDFTLQDLRQR